MMSGPTSNIPSQNQATPPQATSYNQGSSMMHHQQQSSQFAHQFIPNMDEGMRHQHHLNHFHPYMVSGEDDMDDSMGEGSTSLREQDRLLPIANVARIMKMAVPSNAKIAKDAKETVQECVSEFIAFVTSEASDRCQQEKRKTINGEDILWAMESLGFDHYVQLLKIYLHKYKEVG